MAANKILLGLLVLCLLQGCAVQSRETPALLPLPPADTLPVLTSAPAKVQPSDFALQSLLSMQAATPENAVAQIRPQALRETAQMVTVQTAISWRYGQLIQATESHAAILDKAFNFSPLLVTQGNALIMPPVLTRAGASMRIEEPHAATTAVTSYELLEEARYVSVAPHWRRYLMTDDFPKPDIPNPTVLPQNAEERALWQQAVREAWALGLEQADQLYTDNVARMVREYRGIMLYHLLTAQQLLTQVQTASSNLGAHIADNSKMHLGQTVYRITAPAMFKAPTSSGGLLVAAPPAKVFSPALLQQPRTTPTSPVAVNTPPVVAVALHTPYPMSPAPLSAQATTPVLPKPEPAVSRHYGYEIIGDSRLKPVQVYDDGYKTFVRLSPTPTAAPVFIAQQQGGDAVANYRLKGDTLVVDAVCTDAVLLFGLGVEQQRVTIRRLD